MSKIVTKGKRVLRDDVWHDDGGEIAGTPADWDPPMTDSEKREAALSDPDCQPTPPGRSARRIARAKFIRHKLSMSQEEFAQRFHIPPSLLRDWEHHLAEPEKAMLTYLQVIEREPETVERALSTIAAE
jgi:putative transcriptional regulator